MTSQQLHRKNNNSINYHLHLFTAALHYLNKLLVTLQIISIHPTNCQMHRPHHYNTLPSNLQHRNMFKNGANRETLRLTLGLGNTSTPSFVGSCRLHKISIFTILMHGPYNYMSLVHFCKVSLESIIDKVLLQFGDYVDINRNVI